MQNGGAAVPVGSGSQAAAKKKEKPSKKAGEVEEFSSDEEVEALVISTRKAEIKGAAKKRGGKANAWLEADEPQDSASGKGKSKADRWLDDAPDDIPTIPSSSGGPAAGWSYSYHASGAS